MKIVKINESQHRRLFEAYNEGFSFEKLSTLGDSVLVKGTKGISQMHYCTKWLGKPFSRGSSRAVYTLSDNMVLKLAYGTMYYAGIDQNRTECELYEEIDSPLITKIFYHDKNFTYLVSESVIPCTEEDFENIFGIPFYHTYFQHTEKERDNTSPNHGDLEVGYDKYFNNIKKFRECSNISVCDILEYIESNYIVDNQYYDRILEQVINGSKWFTDFVDLVKKTKMSDFCQLENFGMVNRNGKPMIVVLDSGLNLNVWEKNYANTR